MKRILAMVLIISTIFSFTGCSGTAKKLSGQKSANPIQVVHAAESDILTSQFAMELLQNSLNEEGNTIISPMSVLCALAMTANGAKGETLAQMEEVLGMTVEQLNQGIYTYCGSLPDEEKCKMILSNSIWLTEDGDFFVNEEFLQTNADYYVAEIFEAPFDQSTVKDINNWIRRNTDGKIKELISDIPDSTIMCLINALSFDAEWSRIYEDYQIREDKFTREDGKTRVIDYMNSEENYYLENEYGTGVIKYYHGGRYAFAGLLPKEGMTVKDYLSTLNGEELYHMLENVQETPVITKIPKFETEYSLEMSAILKQMGMEDIFDVELADLTGIGTSATGNIYVSQVIHKACIIVDEKGTEAGAATAVLLDTGAAIPVDEPEPKQVLLDRPFVYLILDMENQVPVFAGVYMMPEEIEK